MTMPDLNLLTALDVLLTEGSVARAATRLNLSPSAMSRTLARLRSATGDPLLVRAGRGLIPTPRALVLRDEAASVVRAAQAVLSPEKDIDLSTLDRLFVIRANEGFVDAFGLALLDRMRADAPNARIQFAPKPDKAVEPLRNATIDLEIGVAGASGPEVRMQTLFRDRFVCVVRDDHPLARSPITPERYAGGQHISVSRRGTARGPIDAALAKIGLTRSVGIIVSSFPAALTLVRGSALTASVPDRQTANIRQGLRTFPLPIETPDVVISQLWHPRLDADPAHRWLRKCMREVCRDTPPDPLAPDAAPSELMVQHRSRVSGRFR